MSETEEATIHKTQWITISNDEYESMIATLEILSDPKLKQEALKGKTQARMGRTRKLSVVAKELGF